MVAVIIADTVIVVGIKVVKAFNFAIMVNIHFKGPNCCWKPKAIFLVRTTLATKIIVEVVVVVVMAVVMVIVVIVDLSDYFIINYCYSC